MTPRNCQQTPTSFVDGKRSFIFFTTVCCETQRRTYKEEKPFTTTSHQVPAGMNPNQSPRSNILGIPSFFPSSTRVFTPTGQKSYAPPTSALSSQTRNKTQTQTQTITSSTTLSGEDRFVVVPGSQNTQPVERWPKAGGLTKKPPLWLTYIPRAFDEDQFSQEMPKLIHAINFITQHWDFLYLRKPIKVPRPQKPKAQASSRRRKKSSDDDDDDEQSDDDQSEKDDENSVIYNRQSSKNGNSKPTAPALKKTSDDSDPPKPKKRTSSSSSIIKNMDEESSGDGDDDDEEEEDSNKKDKNDDDWPPQKRQKKSHEHTSQRNPDRGSRSSSSSSNKSYESSTTTTTPREETEAEKRKRLILKLDKKHENRSFRYKLQQRDTERLEEMIANLKSILELFPPGESVLRPMITKTEEELTANDVAIGQTLEEIRKIQEIKTMLKRKKSLDQIDLSIIDAPASPIEYVELTDDELPESESPIDSIQDPDLQSALRSIQQQKL